MSNQTVKLEVSLTGAPDKVSRLLLPAMRHTAAVKRDRNHSFLLQSAPRAYALGGESGE